jgi:hypothetical protein
LFKTQVIVNTVPGGTLIDFPESTVQLPNFGAEYKKSLLSPLFAIEMVSVALNPPPSMHMTLGVTVMLAFQQAFPVSLV